MTTSSETVWVFHGDDARFSSGVFLSFKTGAHWVGHHRLSGILTEYPVDDGCYDIAVRDGHFRPSKPHHGTPTHVAGFSPGWTSHTHFVDGERF